MKLGLYAVKDDLKGFYNVTVADNDQVAYRDFAYACNTEEIIKLNNKNFSFYKVGVYNSDTGVIDTKGYPLLIVEASSVTRNESVKNDL